MDIKVGSVVKSCAGRDKDSFFVAVGISGGFVEIANGKERKLEKPKRKNIKHISPTGSLISMEALTNKKLKKVLNEFSTQGLRQP